MNEFGVYQVWMQGDALTRGVALVLLIMSVMSWTVIVLKLFQQWSLKKAMAFSKHQFWQMNSLSQGVEGFGKGRYNPFRELVLTGHAADSHQYTVHHDLSGKLDLCDWLARCLKNVLDDSIGRLQTGLGILASIGSTAPFIGLLGTVWGIYHALGTLSQIDQPDIAHVAGPVGESLIMTAFGLFVAIPAVLGFNAISRRNKTISHALNRFAHDLHAFYLTGSRVVPNVTALQNVRAATVTEHKGERTA